MLWLGFLTSITIVHGACDRPRYLRVVNSGIHAPHPLDLRGVIIKPRVCTGQTIPYTYLQIKCAEGSKSRKPRLVARRRLAVLLFVLVLGGHDFFRSLQHPLVPRRPIVHLRRKGPFGSSVNSEYYVTYFTIFFAQILSYIFNSRSYRKIGRICKEKAERMFFPLASYLLV